MLRIVRIARDVEMSWLGQWFNSRAEVAQDSESLWLRFSADNAELMQRAWQLPGVHFRWLDGGYLVRDQASVAEAKLPELNWQEIDSMIQFELPVAAMAGKLARAPHLTWQLVRGGEERPSAAAIVQFSALSRWVNMAPQSRLDRLRYCLTAPSSSEPVNTADDATMLALVYGTPLPPLACEYLVQHDRVLLPAGWQWQPALELSWVERSFGISEGQWLLWRSTDDWCVLKDEVLQPLSRSSMRHVSAALESERSDACRLD